MYLYLERRFSFLGFKVLMILYLDLWKNCNDQRRIMEKSKGREIKLESS